MIEAGAEYELEIESVSSDGNGVGHIDGMAVFVPLTAAGDRIRARIVRAKRSYAEAELLSIVRPSADRTEPLCGHFYECGGCALMHMSYEAQLRAKRGMIENAMRRIGGFAYFALNSMTGAENTLRYRNKTIFHAGEKNGAPIFGFYAPKSHRVIPLRDCPIGAEENKALIAAVTEYISETGAKVQSLFTRRSRKSGEVMAVICADRELPGKDGLVSHLRAALPQLSCVTESVRRGRREIKRVLFGKGYIEDELLGISYRISPDSFFQINPEMTEKLYTKAIELADISSGDSVMDIYCGIGTISLTAAKKAARVTGIEIVEQAIADAKENAARNGIENAEFHASSAEDIVPALTERGERPDIVILDPPRKGSDEKTIEAILKSAPKRIVYVSCSPSTLARDAKALRDGGYEIREAHGFDMFPNTNHVETVCLLSKLKSSEHIDVELSMDELDLTAAEKKATYQEIKDYVLEHYGLKVSQLNIAQVKRKCGIIERENYNKPKSEDSKQPNCTQEKEDAITETLKHFGMIE